MISNEEMCPHCSGQLEKKYSVWHILIAIVLFPWGLLILLFPWLKCSSCGKWVKNKSAFIFNKDTMSNVKDKISAVIQKAGNISHKIKNSKFTRDLKISKGYGFFDKNKLWLIPSVIALCAVTIFVTLQVKKANYIKTEFAYAAQAQASEEYYIALDHIDNILRKDNANLKALELKTELERLEKEKNIADKISRVEIYRDEGNYIEGYNLIKTVLEIEPSNERALTLKNELLPLAQQQEQQQAQAKAEADAAQQAAQAAEQAEKEVKEAAAAAEKQNNIQTLVNTYVFDGELAVKILQADKGHTSGTYKYGQTSNDAKGNYYPVAHSMYGDTWQIYNVYESGLIESKSFESKISGYTTATGAASKTKAEAQQEEKVNSDLDKVNSAIEDAVNGVNLDKTYYGNGYTINYSSNHTVEYEDGFLIITDPESGANISITDEVESGSINGISKAQLEQTLGVSISNFHKETINGINVIAYDYNLLNNVSVFVYEADRNYMVVYQRKPDISAAKEIEMVKILSTFNIP